MKRFLFLLLLPLTGTLCAESSEHAFNPRPAVTFPVSFWKSNATPGPTATATATATPTVTPTATPTATPGGSPSPLTFTYSSDGDTNGILYYLGTNFGAIAWENPHTAGRVTIIAVPVGGAGTVATLVDRAASNYSTAGTDGAGNEWFTIDLGSGRTVLASKFSYRYRDDSTGFAPTAWKWEGSNDNSSWDELADVSGQTPVMSAWVSTDAATMTTDYRYIRIRQIGNNSSGTSHFSGGELEIYGVFSF